jgi:hypothetical protein
MGPEDIDRMKNRVRRVWNGFNSVALESTDPEVKRWVRKERWKRRKAREADRKRNVHDTTTNPEEGPTND